jgi:O-acetyl-ADP-ribose deacetylase (regulator of RNase III)
LTFRIIKGDLFDPAHRFTALAQGTNCRGVMGAGIAVPFKQKFPEMFVEYVKLCNASTALLPGTAQVWIGSGDEPGVINVFSQYQPGRGNAVMEYLERGLHSMDQQLNLVKTVMEAITAENPEGSYTLTQRVGLPLIGGGIGGLERHNIINAMELILGPSEHEYTLVERD